MTSNRPQSRDDKRSAVARAADALPGGDPRAHVFYEERTDTRVSLGSSGSRDAVTTLTAGGTIAGTSSVHDSHPDFLEPRSTLGSDPDEPRSDLDQKNWVAKLEAAIVHEGAASSAGRSRSKWAAKLVAFRQEVWVGRPQGAVTYDVRRGSRLELRVELGVRSKAHAVRELVLNSVGDPPIRDAFDRAFERAEQRRLARRDVDPGVTAAVFEPGAGGIVVHELIGHALEGDIVTRQPTWISDGGLPGARRQVTVIDDPRRGRGAWRTDDEGVSSRETVLVDKGRVTGLILDRGSASTLGRDPTGHGRRSSYLDPVRARMGCTFIEAGTDDASEILRSTRAGVFIRRLIGGHADPISGRATFIVSDADRIEDGLVTETLNPFVIELDGPEAWASIDRVGCDLAFDACIGSCVRDGQPIAVSVGAPTIRIGVVRVRS